MSVCVSLGKREIERECVCVRVCVCSRPLECARVRVWLRACVCACVCACVSWCAFISLRSCVCAGKHFRMCVYSTVCEFASRSANGRLCVCVCHRSVGRVAVGVTWTRRAHFPPWAARCGHTSLTLQRASRVDGSGTIYIIGGRDSGGTVYNDVWVSSDGGANRTRAGTWRVLEEYYGVLDGYKGYAEGTRGTQGGYSGGPHRT